MPVCAAGSAAGCARDDAATMTQHIVHALAKERDIMLVKRPERTAFVNETRPAVKQKIAFSDPALSRAGPMTTDAVTFITSGL